VNGESYVKQPADLFSLENRVAIVTGASSGLGVTFARGLAAAGARVVLAARRVDRLEGVVGELAAEGHEAFAVGCDVSKEDDVDAMVGAVIERFGGIDVLVNNAGVSYGTPAEEESLEDFERLMAINVTGSFLCAQRCGRVMLEAGSGSIVNVASIMGFVGIGQIPQLAYNTSKGAIVNFTRELAAQWARRGVRVNAVAPGFFPSEMTDGMFDDEKTLRFLRRKTPMGRPGKPDELLGALLLLASDAGSYMTGQTLIVDGGWTIV
jgi:NAD(P)-dependent dehydrogenase (short-subunit alcohol dehydrogenase family)